MKRIVFVAPPFAGHFNPLLVLANAARGAGYQTEFITGPRKIAAAERNGHRAIAPRSIGMDALEAIANTSEPVRSNPFRLLAQFRENMRLLPAIGDELVERWQGERPELVVADSVAPIAGLAAERLGIRWITTAATPITIETRRGIPSYCGGWMPGSPLRDAAGRAAIRAFKQSVGLLFREEFRRLGLRGVYREDGSEAIYSPYAILGFGISELEFERDWPSHFQMLGPMFASPGDAAPFAFDEPRPRVLVTHGTHLLWAKRTLFDEVCALSDAMPHVHFVVSYGNPDSAAPARAGRVRAVPFLDYEQHLDGFDAVIHHGGTGIAYATISAGLPCIAVPRDYDQFDYAARLEYHGLGLRSKAIANAAPLLTRILDRSQWPALERFRAYARAYTPAATFLETVKRLSQSL
jgi:UDP:flavonoid glycosyltransferase YjiC (YdhE family)